MNSAIQHPGQIRQIGWDEVKVGDELLIVAKNLQRVHRTIKTDETVPRLRAEFEGATVYLLTLPAPQKSAVECYNEARDLIEKTWENIQRPATAVGIQNILGEYLKRTRRIPTDAVEPAAKPAEVKAETETDTGKGSSDTTADPHTTEYVLTSLIRLVKLAAPGLVKHLAFAEKHLESLKAKKSEPDLRKVLEELFKAAKPFRLATASWSTVSDSQKLDIALTNADNALHH